MKKTVVFNEVCVVSGCFHTNVYHGFSGVIPRFFFLVCYFLICFYDYILLYDYILYFLAIFIIISRRSRHHNTSYAWRDDLIV